MSEANVIVIPTEAVQPRRCKVCGDLIEFSRRAARVWSSIEFCSAACRRMSVSSKAAPKAARKSAKKQIA
jgi:hypothetical protein